MRECGVGVGSLGGEVIKFEFAEKLIECLRSRIGQAEWDLFTEIERH